MYRVYQVTKGDTIEKISHDLGINPMDLININGLPGELMEGQFIVIPNQDNIFMTYTIVNGDTMYDIARRNNISIEDLLRINGLNKDDYIYPGQEILIPKQGIGIYVTDNNDTLKTVSDSLRISPVELINQNDTIFLLPDQLIVYKR